MQSSNLIVDGSFGIYVPQRFVRRYAPADWGVSDADAAILESGPDHPEYWDTWSDVLRDATHTDNVSDIAHDMGPGDAYVGDDGKVCLK
jgi:predicted kinase